MPSQDWYLTEYAGDVVDYLTDQHDELQTLLGTVLPASGRRRQAAFDAVRELGAASPTYREDPGAAPEADPLTGRTRPERAGAGSAGSAGSADSADSAGSAGSAHSADSGNRAAAAAAAPGPGGAA
jgi:hypothetical protein